jgi:hypothetical protein
MFTKRTKDEEQDVVERAGTPVHELVTLAELVAEGFGETGYSFCDPLAELEERLADVVELDDIGRRCVPRPVARRMFAERAEAEAETRRRGAERRRMFAARSRPVVRGKRVPDELTGANGELPDPLSVLRYEESIAAADSRTRERLAVEREAAQYGSSAIRPIRDARFQEGA